MTTPSLTSPTAEESVTASEQGTIPFTTYDEMLSEADALFQARRQWQKAASSNNDHLEERCEQRYRDLRAKWHARAEVSDLPLCRRSAEAGLTKLERELLWGVMSLNIGEGREGSVSDSASGLLKYIAIERGERLAAVRCLDSSALLFTHKFLSINENSDGEALLNEVFVDPGIISELLHGKPQPMDYWNVEHEHELYDSMRKLYRLWEMNADEYVGILTHGSDSATFRKRNRQIDREWNRLMNTLKRHPTWSWNRPEVQHLADTEKKTLFALSAVVLGILPEECTLCTGHGLASMLTDDPERYRSRLAFLKPNGVLLSQQWIRPISEGAEQYTWAEGAVHEIRFELDDRAFEVLNLDRPKHNRVTGVTIREPKIPLSQLVLSPKIEQSLRLTITQARAERTLLQEWGLAERIQYGLHPVLLFYGPPGTGKTVTAEALAHELRRPLIVADYSKITSAYLGMTEKNIVRVFQEAQRRKAVLFWDEADAMLVDRDDAYRSWEVRAVNVILQQLERFEGVCILATNRRHKLDKALSRRISMHVEFRRPQTAAERLRIWNAMLPPQLPLDSTVDLGVLAEEDLSGGEIKNVLLNAARFAAARGDDDPRLTQADFADAVRWETEARQQKRSPMGFGRASLK